MSRPAIRSLLVVGDGIVGLSAALAFGRALPGVTIRLLALPGDPAAIADRFPATLPAVGRFHASIGLDELDLVARGIAIHHLGTRFEGGAAGDWTHSFGDVGRGEGVVPFHQMWLAARRAEEALGFDRYSPASAIGKAGKFVHPSGNPATLLGSYLYGLRLNPERYRTALAEAAIRLARVEGEIASIERRDDGGIAALALADGRRLEADLFVDCSGPTAVLISALSDAFEDWAQWLPARHVAASVGAAAPLEPLDRVEQVKGGFRLTSTVPGATLRAEVTCTKRSGSVAIRPGRRRESFIRNVLAIGDSAVALDPLLGDTMSLAHSAILRAIALFPARDCSPVELAEYNRLTLLETDRARDLHALFQSQLPKVAPPPDSLARTLTQWRARGRLPFFEEESFTESSWAQMMIGLGILPDTVTPLATAIDPAAAAAAMRGLAQEIDALADRLPPYAEYLAKMARPKANPRPR